MNNKSYTTMIGISLDGGSLSAVMVRRSGDRIHVRKTLKVPLALDPLTGDPERVGREIRSHLSEAGFRGSQCVVGLPLKMALTFRTEMPDLPDEDIQSYLAVQAERELPFSPDDLSLASSRYETPGGRTYTTGVAIPLNRLTALRDVFKAARLRPVSMTLGITALHDSSRRDEGTVDLLVTDRSVELQIQAGGGIVALRTLEEFSENDRTADGFDAESIARQIKITLGQLPQDIRTLIRTARLFGEERFTKPLLDGLRHPIERMGLKAERDAFSDNRQITIPNDVKRPSPTVLGIAANVLLRRLSVLEFLPPQVSRFKQMAGQFSSKGILWLGGTAAASVLIVATALIYQYWRLSSLESKWNAIESKVAEIEELQKQVRAFRPWFDESIQSLLIMRELTQAFPEDGAVWIKTLEIKEQSEISCSGYARTNQDLLNLHDRLREMPGIDELKLYQFRGEAPLQFTLNYQNETAKRR